MGRKLPECVYGILGAGILDKKNGKRSVFLFGYIEFDERIRDAGRGLHSIVKEIAKERSQIVGVHKIERVIQRINYKGNILLFAFFFVAAENGVQGGVFAYL